MATMPVEVDGVVYAAAGYSVIHAVDVRSGKLLWKYDPHVGIRKMRMAWGIRGLTYWNGKIYAGVQDGRLFALDAKTRALVWDTQPTQPDPNRTITRAPPIWQGSHHPVPRITSKCGAASATLHIQQQSSNDATGPSKSRSVSHTGH